MSLNCSHHSLDKNTQWYWGYVHKTGKIQIKSLYIPNHGLCDLCYTIEEVSQGNDNVIAIIRSPRTTRQAVHDDLYDERYASKPSDRFELLEIE